MGKLCAALHSKLVGVDHGFWKWLDSSSIGKEEGGVDREFSGEGPSMEVLVINITQHSRRQVESVDIFSSISLSLIWSCCRSIFINSESNLLLPQQIVPQPKFGPNRDIRRLETRFSVQVGLRFHPDSFRCLFILCRYPFLVCWSLNSSSRSDCISTTAACDPSTPEEGGPVRGRTVASSPSCLLPVCCMFPETSLLLQAPSIVS